MTVYCHDCRYLKKPKPPIPFLSSRMANRPDMADICLQYYEQEQERQRQEKNMVEQEQPFFFQPRFYYWCEYYSQLASGITLLGEEVKIYEPIDYHNAELNCPSFQPRPNKNVNHLKASISKSALPHNNLCHPSSNSNIEEKVNSSDDVSSTTLLSGFKQIPRKLSNIINFFKE